MIQVKLTDGSTTVFETGHSLYRERTTYGGTVVVGDWLVLDAGENQVGVISAKYNAVIHVRADEQPSQPDQPDTADA